MPVRLANGSLVAVAAFLVWTCSAAAHPMVEDALDLVIAPQRITLVARVSLEEILLTQAAGGAGESAEMLSQSVAAHGAYLLRHLHLRVDGREVGGTLLESEPPGRSKLVTYQLEYPLSAPPGVVRVDQDLLREFESWSASCVVRVRQSDQHEFQIALLTRDKSVEFTCDWPSGAATTTTTHPAPAGAAVSTTVRFWPTVGGYFTLGVEHILTGYDHLLFVAALVLAAAARLWDLVMVVTAFTLAHTLTLTLSVLNIVSLPGRMVEPMIAASIVFVAVQNVLWPGQRLGWSRMAVAFGFGLFHGLGFAGGLKEAMSGMPGSALGAALGGFSVGVEAGHQIVVLPLFVMLYAVRNYRVVGPARMALANGILRYGSCAISIAGVCFLVKAIW
jgi:hypothetical protein